MQKNLRNQNAAEFQRMDDDEIDILELLGILLAKWPVLLAFVVVGALSGGFVANYIRPSYASDALLQVDLNGSSLGIALGDMGAMLDGASPSDAEIQLIRSRRVLDEVVKKERLSFSATPVAFLPRLFHTEGRVDVELLHLPRFDENARFFLVASPDSALSDSVFQIVGNSGKVYLDGRVGDTYRIPLRNDTLAVCILSMQASPSERFLLGESDARDALDRLRADLEVAEQGKKTGVIQMRISHRYADRAAQILNSVADTYVRQNVEARSEEATKTLNFLEKQLPEVKAKLDSAEQVLSLYRQREGSIDLNGEARSALEKRMELEKRQLELVQKRQEAARLFKEDHPSVVALKRQESQIKREMAKLGEETKDLPYKQQEILRLQGDVEVNSSIYTNMLNNIQQLRVVQAGEVGNARIVDRARIEINPVKPKRKIIFLGGVAGGFVLGTALIFLFRLVFNRGVRSSRELEGQTGVSVYAKIPETKASKRQKGFSLVEENGDDFACEALRTLRTSLEFSLSDEKRIVLVSGCRIHSGKSFVAKNLAALFALSGKRTLLVDLDFRAGRLSPRGRERGLSDYLLKRITLDEAIDHLEGSNIDLLGAGSFVPSPSEMISSSAFENLVRKMRERYDLVILDSAPLLYVADAQIACRYADFALLVVQYGKDSMEDIQSSLSLFDKANMTNRAMVMNRVVADGADAYGYKYGGGVYGEMQKFGKKRKNS